MYIFLIFLFNTYGAVLNDRTSQGNYKARYALYESELFVSTVNPIITHNYDNNSIRKSRNDKSNAIKIANYTLTNQITLPKYIPEEYTRHSLKVYSHQYNKSKKISVMLRNNIISLLDNPFPETNELFSSPPPMLLLRIKNLVLLS